MRKTSHNHSPNQCTLRRNKETSTHFEGTRKPATHNSTKEKEKKSCLHTEEKEESLPPHEAVLPQGVMEEDILPKRYEIFTWDHNWVQDVRCSLLGLETETTPSRRDIDNSSHFIPQAVASKSDLPDLSFDFSISPRQLVNCSWSVL